MKLLALDTSSVACSVAALNEETIVARHEEQPRAHTRLLMPMIRAALDEAGLTLNALDAVVLGNGPGSFIGMRIGASVAQGLAFAAGLQVVPVSSMAVVAAEAAEKPSDIVAVAQDAHMSEVYLGIYRVDDAGLPVAIAPERLHKQAPIEEIARLDEVVAAGHGWRRYPALLEANRVQRVSDVCYPRATRLLTVGASVYEHAGGIEPQAVVPAYLRQQVAEVPR